MTAPMLVVPYPHDPADLQMIDLAVSVGAPTDTDWLPALRDTINGQLVIWVRAELQTGQKVWVRDRSGIRRVHPLPTT